MNRFFCGVLLFFLTTEAGFPLGLEQIVPFANSNSVRVVTSWLGGDEAGLVQLKGTITEFDGGAVLWTGDLTNFASAPGQSIQLTNLLSQLRPKLWEPARPALYNLEITAAQSGKNISQKTVRFGFRSFSQRDGQLILNGRPIFLRGIAINPPGRTIPDNVGNTRQFAEDYVRCVKAAHVNLLRLSKDAQVWFDVCDELGMMVYQGDYGAPPRSDSKKLPPTDVEGSIADYKELFSTYERHPSIVIYILANELPTGGPRGHAFSGFMNKACDELKAWDPDREFIGNAGYGEGREGDLQDVHRYWGWYYNTFLTFYNLRSPHLFGDPAKIQPLTFSECVGCFTGPVGGFNIITRKQLAPQLNWTGHATNQTEAASAYQCRMVREVAEAFRRLRPLNPHIAGLMPFSIFFANWEGIHSFAEMHANANLAQLGRSYQPILLSWEDWKPQVYAGAVLHPIAHVINDADDGSDVHAATLHVEVRSADNRLIYSADTAVGNVPYYETKRLPLEFSLPADLPTGDYILNGILRSDGRDISSNSISIFVANRKWNRPEPAPVQLYDPLGKTADAFHKLNIEFQAAADLSHLGAGAECVVIGEDALLATPLDQQKPLRQFIQTGGRVLCLRQGAKTDPGWFSEPIRFFTGSPNNPEYPVRVGNRPFAANMCINLERPEHPVFKGLSRDRFIEWSDYVKWDQTKPGFPQIYPVTSGFALNQVESLAHTAILADYDHALEGTALAEMFDGKGSMLLSAFDLVRRAGLDPVADRLLRNTLDYMMSAEGHYAHPLIGSTIKWGNYGSERGLLTGPLNGLIANADWVIPPTNPDAKPLKQAQGEWNSKPGDAFLPHGRSPFGPYTFSPAATPESLAPAESVGHGYFWTRIPRGKKTMVTTVRNPVAADGVFSVSIDQTPHPKMETIPSGQVSLIRTSLPTETTDIEVNFNGTKTLVILETRFE